MSIEIKIINQSNNLNPEYATSGAAGLDVCAYVPQDIVLEPGKRALIPTGLFVEIPEGYEIQVRPRSGLAINKGITCLNSPGTIDSDYRGEIKVILINTDDVAHTISSGDRIAQLVIAKVERGIFTSVQQINKTDRGEGGFGHTGINTIK